MSQVAVDRTSSSQKTGKVANIVLWVLQIAAAAMFLMAGLPKLLGAQQVVAVFDTIGIGQWFRYLTGALEVAGAVALLIPRLSGAGALLLICIMIGAVFTHLFVIGGSPAGAIVLLLVSIVIAYGRLDRTLRLLGR